MRINRFWRIILSVLATLVLAFLLQDVMVALIIDPLVELFWSLSRIYHSIADFAYWIIVLTFVTSIYLTSLGNRGSVSKKSRSLERYRKGPVEDMAWLMKASQRGEYFRWRIANRLGQLALSILSRDTGSKASSFSKDLLGKGWDPPQRLQEYLNHGLGQFIRPVREGFFKPHPPSPYQYDIEEVIEYLESQMELRSGRKYS